MAEEYIPIATADAIIGEAISKALNGVALARKPNSLVLNPKVIVVDFTILVEANAVPQYVYTAPAVEVQTVTDTPATMRTEKSQDTSETSESTESIPERITTNERSGEDSVTTDKDYEEF